ncbi:ABC transporter ATP-binding protein [Labrys wisconsinensis]|uniref:Multiple sugar transport system ATP-binding protein n=1 Tax=Labrys wisconsinensis TaxID=425677 RepID=A0ABU0J0G2_9HYPH|nr:ABC transporter ATP-binding protein [Labrys wisconsinensis]MDQ0467755.1 multiple sugar transport system ATP-binding protein [Labrys wisconsinensis]
MPALSFQSISKAYRGRPALEALSFDVEPQSFTVICGPPKAGKSVLFRLLVGLEQPDAGCIMLAGEDITRLSAAQRAIGYVPQSFALYPHLTVRQNIAYPLTLARAPQAEIARRVDRAAGILSIAHLLAKTPDQLSGGEKQRVAVARGLLKNADVFVLDDPLVGLDYKLRERLMDELKGLREELKATFLYATSDSLEALTMAQRLVVLDAGRLVEHDEATRIYHDPGHARSLDLIGFPHANLLKGRAEGTRLTAGPLTFGLAEPLPAAEVLVGLRPEALKLGTGAGIDFQGRVRLVENLGGEAVVYAQAGGQDLTLSLPLSGEPPPDFDAAVALTVDPGTLMLFDAASGRRLTFRAAQAELRGSECDSGPRNSA